MRALNAMTQPNGFDLAILVASPGVHGHWVGIVEEQRSRLGQLADIAAEIEQRRDGALGVEQAAGAQRVAHALVHSILQWNINVELESVQAALANQTDHV